MINDDPTERDYWRGLRALQEHLDAEIAALYAERGVDGVRPRFAYPLIRLAHRGPMTLRELAASLGRSHSALSQTVTAMRAEDLVETAPGADARTRVVRLTERGRSLVPFLEAEWRATEDAIEALDAELPVRLADYVAAMRARLEQRGFRDRIAERLDHPPAGDADEAGDPGR
ncbi:MarR family winged helix-turn-helix transcriptional regulator [Glycomyces sp. A-F 0318]|uniref:MarR family winged helix-turn-helix transcriptional regulator n=1 Tax=Glycomyces amatae TaxID=2881355 RepID=UPI001E36784A|nr:MarR family winged helix-turn-helix transcriptional regulator [Glycomyces amatae]